jgi:hypothetical protein
MIQFDDPICLYILSCASVFFSSQGFIKPAPLASRSQALGPAWWPGRMYPATGEFMNEHAAILHQ